MAPTELMLTRCLTRITKIANSLIEERGSYTPKLITNPVWKSFSKRTYECRVLLCPEKGGGFSAHALRLPGVVSQGDTVEEALLSIADAFEAAMQIYLDQGGAIPWRDIEVERTKGSLERWILVNV